MKKIFWLFLFLSASSFILAQDEQPKNRSNVKLTNRSNDHFMIQYGIANWANKPDSINLRGFSRSFNFYIMLDFPFRTDPRFSVAFGPGLGTDHIFFEKTRVTIADHNGLRFQDVSDTNYFEKYKLASAYLEVPVELRFAANPLNTNKSFKVALGLKVGTLLDIHTKGKNFVDRNGKTVSGFDSKYLIKEKDKFFFNSNRFVGTARVGYGVFTLFGTYQLGPLIKEGRGPDVRPYTIGLTLSGL